MPNIIREAFRADFSEHKPASINSDATDSFQVIGAGLPRCGTSSLKAALELLGFEPCHHMIVSWPGPILSPPRQLASLRVSKVPQEFVAGLLLNYTQTCVQDPARSRLFGRIYDAQKLNETSRLELLRTAMLGFKATVDSPGAELYQELKMLYPSAKVILNVRDSGDVWWRSVKDTIDLVFSTRYAFLSYPLGDLREQRRMAMKMKEKWCTEGGYGPGHYEYHNEQVRKNVPKEDLLEFNVKQGWGPLCAFLGVAVPDVSFPNLNDTKSMQSMLKGVQLMGACTWALYLGAAGVATWMALRSPAFLRGLFATYKSP